jgi:Fe-S oxidoreductase
VLTRLGYHVMLLRAENEARPLCCGRTFLSVGLVDEARAEARRLLAAAMPLIERGIPVVGLEPSCLFSLRDEFPVMGFDRLAKSALLFEEFLAREPGRLKLKETRKEVLLHGHCHQKAFDAMRAVERTLGLVPELKVRMVESSCCGMAGTFGYEAKHYDVSMKMAELSLLPAVRTAAPETLIVADGFSCRHQVADGTGRDALHVARVLDLALDSVQ